MGCSPKNLIYGRLLGIWGFSVYGLFGSGAFGYTGFWVYGLLGIRAFQYTGFSVVTPLRTGISSVFKFYDSPR
jgi:hypothetical protein